MERDPKFEVQFLLTVTIAVVTFLASSRPTQVIDIWVGIGSIVLLSVHIVLLNVIYLLDGVNDWNMIVVEDLRGHSQMTYQLVTALIPFLLLHGLLFGSVKSFTNCDAIGFANLLSGRWLHFCSGGAMFIGYLTPFLITGVAMAKFRKDLIPSLTTFRHINFVVAPIELSISSLFEDTEPLFVKIENLSSAQKEFDLEVKIPEEVEWKMGSRTGVGSIEMDISLDSDRAVRRNILLQYIGDSRQRDIIDVTLTHPRGTKSETVEVLLEP